MIWHAVPVREAASILKTNTENGLSPDEAARRIEEFGKNRIEAGRGRPLLVRFLLQFKDFMILILLAAAAVSFVTSWVAGKIDFIDPLIIFAIVTVNAVSASAGGQARGSSQRSCRTSAAASDTGVRTGAGPRGRA